MYICNTGNYTYIHTYICISIYIYVCVFNYKMYIYIYRCMYINTLLERHGTAWTTSQMRAILKPWNSSSTMAQASTTASLRKSSDNSGLLATRAWSTAGSLNEGHSMAQLQDAAFGGIQGTPFFSFGSGDDNKMRRPCSTSLYSICLIWQFSETSPNVTPRVLSHGVFQNRLGRYSPTCDDLWWSNT